MESGEADSQDASLALRIAGNELGGRGGDARHAGEERPLIGVRPRATLAGPVVGVAVLDG